MEQVKNQRWGIDGFSLKMIALITMAIDHTGMVLFPQYRIMRIIGRLAFPIYCFLLVEGTIHTSNSKKYLGRLLVFALLSEIPFNLVCSGKIWYPGGQNVFLTLAIGFIALLSLQKNYHWLIKVSVVAICVLLAEYTGGDYGAGGILIIVWFYVCKTESLERWIGFGVITAICYGGLQNYAILSLLPISFYNGKRGRSIKYIFYCFYPLHLLLLYCLKVFF